MKEEELFNLKKRLFDQGLVSKLAPDNIRMEQEDELFIFSDYYGALIGIERLLKNKETYRSFNSGNFEAEYRLVLEQLAKNLFVPNYQTTFGRKLNDRIRGLLRQEEILPGTKELDELILIDVPPKLIRDYADFFREFLFRLRPQVSKQEIQPQEFEKQIQLREKIIIPAGQIVDNPVNLEDYLPSEVDGEEIREASFFYQGERYFSTRAFVREWDQLKSYCEKLEKGEILKLVKKKPRKLISRRLKKIVGVGLMGLLGLGGTSVFFPEIRYKYKLPVTQMEEVEILSEQGQADKVVGLLKKQDLAPNLFSYWKSKAILNHLYHKLEQTDNLNEKYWFANEIVRGKHTKEMEKAEAEFGAKIIQEEIFKLGYVKRGEDLNMINDYSTPQLAAHSHLASLLMTERKPSNPMEAKVLNLGRKRTIFCLGGKDQIYFLTEKQEKFSFLVDKISSGKYRVMSISLLK